MKDSGGTSSQEVGKEQCAKLEQWIAKTALNAVPLNRFGKSAKSTICRLLDITTSTIRTNIGISQAFEKLDNSLSRRAHRAMTEESPPTASTHVVKFDLPELLDEIGSLRCEVARLRHLTHTGQWIEE